MVQKSILAALVISQVSLLGACGEDKVKDAVDVPSDSNTAPADADDASDGQPADVESADSEQGDATPADATEAADVSDGSDPGDSEDVTADVEEPAAPPYGMVFVQRFGVGLASYDFVSPDEIYIDYSLAENMGLRLDSGDLPPHHKPFTDVTYDADNRRFTGTVDWQDDPFLGFVRFEYDWIFAPDFSEIESGTAIVVAKDGSETSNDFGDTVSYRAATPADPYPFAELVKCLSRPLPLDAVVFVGVFEDGDCTRPTGTIITLPSDDTTPCCEGPNQTDVSFSNFSCGDGGFTFRMADGPCATEPTGETAYISENGCTSYPALGGLYLKLLPGGGCAP